MQLTPVQPHITMEKKMKFPNLTSKEKLDSSITTLIILLPRLTVSYRNDVEYVINYLKDVRENPTY